MKKNRKKFEDREEDDDVVKVEIDECLLSAFLDSYSPCSAEDADCWFFDSELRHQLNCYVQFGMPDPLPVAKKRLQEEGFVWSLSCGSPMMMAMRRTRRHTDFTHLLHMVPEGMDTEAYMISVKEDMKEEEDGSLIMN